MKIFIALLALVAISFVQAEPRVEKMTEFVAGILEGVNESGDINKLLPCISADDNILVRFKEALDHLHLRNPEELRRGLIMFFEAAKSLLTKLKACMEGFPVLQKLAEALVHPDHMRIINKIMTHFSQFITDVTKARTCFTESHYHCAGESIGDILEFIFLTYEESEVRLEKMQEFVAGILEGVNEPGDLTKLIPCIKAHDNLLQSFREALEHLNLRHPEELRRGVIMFFDATKELFDMLKNCMDGFLVLKKLADALVHPDHRMIINKIMAHFPQFITDVTKARTCFTEGHYHCAGESIGDILEFIFLTSEIEEPTADKMQEFVAGILEGVNEPGDINKLVPCIKPGDTIFEHFREALEYLSRRHPDEIRRGLKLFFDTSKLVLDMLKDCLEGFPLLKKISDYLVNPDYMRIINKIMMHFAQFITDVTKARTCFTEGHYHCAGESIGDILEFIFLTY